VIVIGPALTQGGTSPNKENVKGDVMAFDVRTGKKLWVFHTIPRFGEGIRNVAERIGRVLRQRRRVGTVLGRRRSATSISRRNHRPTTATVVIAPATTSTPTRSCA
jgi:hypothetical protein